MSKKRLLALVAVFVFVAFPLVTFAWVPGEPIVPDCSLGGGQGPYCQACDLLNLINNLLAFGVYFSTVVATLLFAYAGFLYVTASANPDNIKRARDIFGKVFLGFIFILTAWLIIDLTMAVFANKKFGTWNDVPCAEFKTSPPERAPLSTERLDPFDEFNEPRCDECVTMDPSIPQKGGLGGQVDRDLNKKLKDADLESLGLQVTENYPPSAKHQSTCHYKGTCVDVNNTDREPSSGKEVAETVSQMKSSGLRAVYEVESEERKQELISEGAPPESVVVVSGGRITAEHYSVYCDTCGG